MNKKLIESTQVVTDTKDARITVFKLSAETKRGLATDGAQIRRDDAHGRRPKDR